MIFGELLETATGKRMVSAEKQIPSTKFVFPRPSLPDGMGKEGMNFRHRLQSWEEMQLRSVSLPADGYLSFFFSCGKACEKPSVPAEVEICGIILTGAGSSASSAELGAV